MKYYGTIGYAVTEETRPGVWKETITERNYSGDFSKITRRLAASDDVNDDINVSNEISILADPYAKENFFAMRYATYMGVKWKITNVALQYPRLILTLGGLYNAEKT